MVLTKVFCSKCGASRENFELVCNTCGSPFIIKVSGPYEKNTVSNYDYFETPIISINLKTPIIETNQFMAKFEFYNPTLSYKDRGMNTLFSFLKYKKFLQEGDEVSEDSSGNAGASFAMFSKMLGLKATVFTSVSANPNKMKQIEGYGSRTERINGSRKDVENSAKNSGLKYLGHQYWPEFYDGFRVIAYEIYEQMEHMPDNILIPFSTGTLYLGIFEGFSHLLQNGLIESIPTLWAIQPEKASGMYNRLNNIDREPEPSIADALTGVLPLRYSLLSSIIKTYGKCEVISENEIIDAKQYLLNLGIDCEYSSAITYAALKKFNLGKSSLLILTGHGIKNL